MCNYNYVCTNMGAFAVDVHRCRHMNTDVYLCICIIPCTRMHALLHPDLTSRIDKWYKLVHDAHAHTRTHRNAEHRIGVAGPCNRVWPKAGS